MASQDGRYRPRKEPRQRRSRQTRDRILTAAARVFSRHGYAAGTTGRIATAARISIGTLYQHFPNKDAVLLELSRRHLDAATAAAREFLAAGGTVADWLPGLIERVVAAHAADPKLHKVLFDEAPRTPELLRRLRRAEDEVAADVAELLRRDPGVHLTDVDTAAQVVVATVESLTHHFTARDPDGFDPVVLRDNVLRLLSAYLLANSPE